MLGGSAERETRTPYLLSAVTFPPQSRGAGPLLVPNLGCGGLESPLGLKSHLHVENDGRKLPWRGSSRDSLLKTPSHTRGPHPAFPKRKCRLHKLLDYSSQQPKACRTIATPAWDESTSDYTSQNVLRGSASAFPPLFLLNSTWVISPVQLAFGLFLSVIFFFSLKKKTSTWEFK